MKELKEEWKLVNGYNISNYGVIISKMTGKPMKFSKNKGGYVICHINLGEPHGKVSSVHRAVAKVFVDNPNNYNEVNHKDANKENNRADNLEWVTHLENMTHVSENRLYPKSIWVCIVSNNGYIIEIFRSLNHFSEVYEMSGEHKMKKDDAYACIIGKQNDFYGIKVREYDFENEAYVKTKFDDPNYKFTSTRKMKLECVETGEIFKSQMDASRKLGISQSLISEALRKNNGRVNQYTFTTI